MNHESYGHILTLVPARQSALRDFFVLPTFRAMANKKIGGKFGCFKEKE